MKYDDLIRITYTERNKESKDGFLFNVVPYDHNHSVCMIIDENGSLIPMHRLCIKIVKEEKATKKNGLRPIMVLESVGIRGEDGKLLPGRRELIEKYKGEFHCFYTDSDGDEVALIEKEDGAVEGVFRERIKFLDKG